MKFIIKSLFLSLISVNTFAGTIKIYYESDKDKELASEVKLHFVNHYTIPKRLVIISHHSCTVKDKRFYEICINEKRELIELPNNNKSKILKSFNVFKTKEI